MSVCLVVIDGWGISELSEGNAILNAKTPVMDELAKATGQYVTLDASGLSVGLPDGLMGNSEVGHLNIGCGRVMYQDIIRINMDVEGKKIGENPNFVECANNAKNGTGRLHLLGLVSDGGVHAHINHLFALLEAAKLQGVPNTYVHFFGDGRDTSPTSGHKYCQQLLDHIKSLGYGSLATVTGRYYAMDRDNRHERIKLAYEGMVQGIGEETTINQVVSLIQKRYENKEDPQTDEFLKPIIVDKNGLIQDNDTLIFFNYRSDRARQLSEAYGIKRQFDTDKVPQNLKICTMTQYKKEFPFTNLYPPVVPVNVLSEWISKKDLPQFHCAETEKYAHVTFFFNGGQEKAFEKEDRLMVPSPKVPTYDHQPEMSCMQVAEEMVKVIEQKKYPFVMCNFAPPDMVGHTGKYEPAVRACEATDKAIGMIQEACKKNGFTMLVTADHGNAEQMLGKDGGPHTAHTCNRVPFCMDGPKKFQELKHNAAICDVAPTVLGLMGLDQPPEMTGKCLLA